MKLHELHVANFSAGAEGHGDAVTGSDGWICGVAVNLSQSARGEQDGAGTDFVEEALLIQYTNAYDLAIAHDELGGEFKFAENDGLHRLSLEVQRAAYLAASRIAVRV